MTLCWWWGRRDPRGAGQARRVVLSMCRAGAIHSVQQEQGYEADPRLDCTQQTSLHRYFLSMRIVGITESSSYVSVFVSFASGLPSLLSLPSRCSACLILSMAPFLSGEWLCPPYFSLCTLPSPPRPVWKFSCGLRSTSSGMKSDDVRGLPSAGRIRGDFAMFPAPPRPVEKSPLP